MVQLCVGDQRGLELLKEELRSVVASEGMQFQDVSKHTEGELKAMNYAAKERTDGSPVVKLDAGRRDGMGVGAGNLGLPGYQVALGFSRGSDEAEARAFASKVIAALEKHWVVHRVPDGQGAMPMDGC